MTLPELLGDVARDLPAVEVTALAYDNRAVAPGTLFFCVPGFTRDGHDFAPAAVAAGAVALVVERPLGLGVPEVVVPSVRAAMAPAAARLNGDPSATLRMVGVTGTNGKTTTCFLLRSLLEAGGLQTGMVGTVTTVVGGHEEPTIHTTPEAIDLQRTLRAMLDAGDKACAMEVSSHALALGRTDAVHWDVALFTNLTQDHLDFHPTMEDYFAAKRRLFAAGPRTMVINVDDPFGARLAADFPEAVTVGIDNQDATLRATELDVRLSGAAFRAGDLELHTRLPGRFNVLNVLGAVAAARALGLDDDAIAAALPQATRAPGRFEPVDAGQGFLVVVDYAHTPDSLDNVLRAARDAAGTSRARVICVFGCGGDRDRGKRPQMGKIANELADVAIVTSDNPRSEDPQAIIDEILAGAGPGVDVHLDRHEAIAVAIGQARPGDVVVIAGKGHEQGQELAGGVKVPFDDVRVARDALRDAAARS
jgi:UDP-N-acetylmuramoyl-L-alanyl-D-glutamate--2,6-diaminopimelate ligase